MRYFLKEMCDTVINSLETPTEDFQDNVREVFCKMDEAYKLTGLNDTDRAEKLSYECRHILCVLRLFPIELQLAMNNLYKKTLCGFLSIYLDFKMMLIDEQPNKEVYFENVMKEIFLLLSIEEKTSIWSVVVTSHTLNRIEILKLLVLRCIEATKSDTYDHDQYIRMIWVLHVFFSQCKRAGIKDIPDKVLEIALKIKSPPGLCKWMCHHFPGFGWKGLTDANVHETLVSEKQPKSFFKQVYQSISKDDTLKYEFQSDSAINGARDEDSSPESIESSTDVPTKKRSNPSPAKESMTSSKKMRTEVTDDPPNQAISEDDTVEYEMQPEATANGDHSETEEEDSSSQNAKLTVNVKNAKKRANPSPFKESVASTKKMRIEEVEDYLNGPYAEIFIEFEESKMVKGAEPFIDLSPLPPIEIETERESTLADILYNNKQKAKKNITTRKKKSRK